MAMYREFRGMSYIDFPSEYCLVDIETTGLDLYSDEIIEIGAIKYSDHEITGQFQTLVQPSVRDGNFVNDFITALTGITSEMLYGAPQTNIAIRNFADFLGDSVIVGYNVSFDVNFLYDNYMMHLQRPLTNNFIDVLRIVRRLCADLPSRDIDSVMRHFEISSDNRHRAIGDCIATQLIYEKLQEEALKHYATLQEFGNTFKTYAKKQNMGKTADEKILDGWKQELYACSSVYKAFRFFERLRLTKIELIKLAEYLNVAIYRYANKAEIIQKLVYATVGEKLKNDPVRKRNIEKYKRDTANHGIVFKLSVECNRECGCVMSECQRCGKPVHEGHMLCHECRWKEQWFETVLNSPEVADRLQRSYSTHILSFDIEKPEAIFSSSTDKNRTTYITDIESCTCRDFEINRRKIPCKHILRLAAELGLIRNECLNRTQNILQNLSDELSNEYLTILRFIIRGRKICIKRLESEGEKGSKRLNAYYEFRDEAREIKQYKFKDENDELLDQLIELGMIDTVEKDKTISVRLPDDMTLNNAERILEIYGEKLPSLVHKTALNPLKTLTEIEMYGRRSEEILRACDAIDTPEWAYRVPRCFNDALDIKLMLRTKNFVEYYAWTQGINFAFDVGDVIYRDNVLYEKGTPALQVIAATSAAESYPGEVTYMNFEVGGKETKTQRDFVRMLIGQK